MASPIEAYIRQAALSRGIDPDIAVRVAKHEGGLNDPTRRAEYVKGGYREPSYGPFQLLIGGNGTGFPAGMGNDAMASGIDPRDPNQWQRGVDFALDRAKTGGWSPWYGAKAAGVTGMEGIGGNPVSLPGKIGGDGMVARNFDPQVAGQTSAPTESPFSFGGGGLLAQNPINPELAALAGEDEKSPMAKFGGLLSALGKAIPDAPQPNLGPMPDARRTGGLLTEFLGNMKRRA